MNIIKEVKALNLPKGEYIVFGSGPMSVHRIRDVRDIDLFVSPDLYQQLKLRGWEEKTRESGDKYLTHKNVEVGKDWDYGSYNPSLKDLLETAEVIDGVPFANLEEVLKWKKALGRDKDKKDIGLIEDYLAKRFKTKEKR